MQGRIDTASKVIQASPQVLYQAFINPEALASWLPPEGMSAHVDVFEPRKSGRYKLTLTYESEDAIEGKTSENTDVSQGVFLEVIPNKKIVQSGTFDSEDPAFSGEMVQSWYFESVSEGTKVTLICENVPIGIRKLDHLEGLNSTLNNLAAYIEELK